MLRRFATALGTLLGAALLVLATALPAWAAQSITLTWVRHAQSEANAAGIIDTTVPGPGLTTLGEEQAQAIAEALQDNDYDGIFVSDMVRTQLTAAPLAADLGITPVVLPGLQEINAGIFEGKGGLLAGIGYALPPSLWILGARIVPVLGGENGNQFEARVNDAVAQIYATGDTNPIAFSHGGTIMAWTLMNVDNPDLLLAITHPLGNTDVVVVTGNPEDGWTLQSWDGIAVDPDPGLLTRLFVAVRSLVVAPQTALYDFCQGLKGADTPAPVSAVVPPPATPLGETPSAASVTDATQLPAEAPIADPAQTASTPESLVATTKKARRGAAVPALPKPAASAPATAPARAAAAGADRDTGDSPRRTGRSHASNRAAA
jgi:broad specificity phosphatase PhoE